MLELFQPSGYNTDIPMDEVTAIVLALGALFAGLLLLSWACGDFRKPPAASGPPSS